MKAAEQAREYDKLVTLTEQFKQLLKQSQE